MKGIITTIVLLVLALPACSFAESLRVSPEWLRQHLDETLVIDTRSEEKYRAGHIPGARNLPSADTYHKAAESGRIATPDFIQKKLQRLGLERDKPVVVYDDGEHINAARVFWVLEVYGLKNVRLMSPGLDGWPSDEMPLVTEVATYPPSNYTISVDHKRIASKFTTQLATKTPGHTIVDAREHLAYIGEISKAKRFGHIPKAINIPIHENLANHEGIQELKSLDELREVYKSLPMENRIVLYCDIGKASAANYLALRELGYDVANYDASWKEWGNDFNLPIEK